ncbi:MAG: glutamate--tRNA ligase [Bacteroidales bacterium]|nr:glutamate--tRNA ligase [Bacteroidales bacterium]
MNTKKIRVRFAPSPTGPLHIGGVRTALYNYLFALKHKGDFILRIEDTDQGRFVEGAEQYIIDSLNWCGINFNEGVSVGGPYAPYRQSERKHIYGQYAQLLIDKGYAYYAFDTAEELEKLRNEYQARKQTFQYDYNTRKDLNNSLNLPSEEVKQKLHRGDKYVIRLKIPENREIKFTDLIRGEVSFHSSQLDDKVLYKSDAMPTYHLANVVDDYLMKISHVIRGEEWLPSTPLHILLYEYLGFAADRPEFAHLPLLLKPDGAGKLSKRDGDRLGFPVFPLQWTDPKTGEISRGFKEDGYLPEAFINFIALLGWNPGSEQEIFNMQQLAELFSLDRIHKAGAKFDQEKAKWFNHQYLLAKTDNELADLLKNDLTKNNIKTTDQFNLSLCKLFKERLYFISDIYKQNSYIFSIPTEYDLKTLKNKLKDINLNIYKDFISEIEKCETLNEDILHKLIDSFIEAKQIQKGQFMSILRILIVGKAAGPDLILLILLLGKEEICKRISSALIKIVL